MRELLVLFVCAYFATAYKGFHGLTYEERTRCVGDNTGCVLNKTQLDIFVVGDTGGISFDITHTIGTYTTTKAQTRLGKLRKTICNKTRLAASMAQLIEHNPVDFFLTVGDNIYFNGVDNVSDERFETLFEEPYLDGRFMVPWYMLAGNHDHLGNIQAQIDYSKNKGKWTFPSLWYKASYSFNGGRSRADFLFIDTIVMCGLSVDPDSRSIATWLWESVANRKQLTGPAFRHEEEDRKQWRWLEKQLNESTADYIFVSGHYPIHSVASHGPTHCLHGKLDPLLRKYNVSAYLAGHDHSLMHFREQKTHKDGHSSTMNYIVSGLGSRLDPSDENLTRDTQKILLYRYPTNDDISWLKRTLRTHLIGRGYGGFVRLVVKANETEVLFHAKQGAPITYRTSILPRKRHNN